MDIKNGADKLNRQRIRNIHNTGKYSYNCGGYALNTFSWYCPSDKDERVCALNNTLEECVNTMLKDFSDLRCINNLNEVRDGEYALAFRLSDFDFHYVKRGLNNVWRSKMGGSQYITTMKEYEVLNEEWFPDYDGEIQLFAKGI